MSARVIVFIVMSIFIVASGVCKMIHNYYENITMDIPEIVYRFFGRFVLIGILYLIFM